TVRGHDSVPPARPAGGGGGDGGRQPRRRQPGHAAGHGRHHAHRPPLSHQGSVVGSPVAEGVGSVGSGPPGGWAPTVTRTRLPGRVQVSAAGYCAMTTSQRDSSSTTRVRIAGVNPAARSAASALSRDCPVTPGTGAPRRATTRDTAAPPETRAPASGVEETTSPSGFRPQVVETLPTFRPAPVTAFSASSRRIPATAGTRTPADTSSATAAPAATRALAAGRPASTCPISRRESVLETSPTFSPARSSALTAAARDNPTTSGTAIFTGCRTDGFPDTGRLLSSRRTRVGGLSFGVSSVSDTGGTTTG